MAAKTEAQRSQIRDAFVVGHSRQTYCRVIHGNRKGETMKAKAYFFTGPHAEDLSLGLVVCAKQEAWTHQGTVATPLTRVWQPMPTRRPQPSPTLMPIKRPTPKPTPKPKPVPNPKPKPIPSPWQR